ncbi:hypothetical protein C8R45DRAFT_1089224 [Mycena sanguinolenta]|nr:hypothetical protein C8R45DRAFT_1089224 [Mycena sanguinolenta]
MYRLAHLCCPALSIQAWIKTLADLHNTAFKPYSAQQFTTSFDLYLEILDNVDSWVKTALGRDVEDWHLKNCCLAYIGLGYDIGCGHEKTIKNSPLAAKAKALNLKMLLEVQWVNTDEEWEAAAELVAMRRYGRAVDTLELLVVKRILELTKMNQSGLSYKMRKHIAKALQVRFKAIQNALNRYNTAADALPPPRRKLTWQEVVDYIFLSNFDLLGDPDGNATICKWAEPATRQILDTYHKIHHAREEILPQKLQIIPQKIRIPVTFGKPEYMRDEKKLLVKKEHEIVVDDPELAFFIRRYRHRWGCFDDMHMMRFQALKLKLGHRFTGTLPPGVHAPLTIWAVAPDLLDVGSEENQGDQMDVDDEEGGENDEGSEDDWLAGVDSDNEGEYAKGEELAAAMEGMAFVAMDRPDGTYGGMASVAPETIEE